MPPTFIDYEPRGVAKEIFSCKEREVILSGPAGTGKSRACLEKLHLCLLKYDGAKALAVRKTQSSLTATGIATYRKEVQPNRDGVKFFGGSKDRPAAFQYPNGATLELGGLGAVESVQKVMSGEYDLIYVQEATDINEGEWEALTTRLRYEVIPYQQIIADCNPQNRGHWVKRRAERGDLLMLESRHEDNPRLWNGTAWTEKGAAYIATLDKLSGVRRERLRYGRWSSAEGMVYDDFDRSLHVIDRFEIPPSWRRIRSIDFGFTNPFVCYDAYMQVLTKDGFVGFKDLIPGVPVATVNSETQALEWQQPTAYIVQHYSGPMVQSEPIREGANFAVTPNHRMVVESRKTHRWTTARADQLPQGSSIPVGWNPSKDESDNATFEIPRSPSARPNRRHLSPITRQAFARFLGLVIAEGDLHVSGSREHPSKYVRITQKKAKDEVRRILDALSWRYSEHTASSGVATFSIGSADLYDFLADAGCCVRSAQKRIPRFAFEWNAADLAALLDGMLTGDGSRRRLNVAGVVISGERYHTTSPDLADDVQEIAARLGLPSKIRKARRSRGYDNPATEWIFTVHFHTKRRAAIERLPLETVDYDGMIYCVTVPNGTLVVRRHGRPMVCGNCQWWAIDGDGRMYLYREIYRTQRLVSDFAEDIKQASVGERIEATVADHDAEGRATLDAGSIRTRPADKAITTGIQSVQDRLRVAGDGKARLFLLRDSLVERDEQLAAAGKPYCTEQEFESYVWPKGIDGKQIKEVPVDLDNHGMDAMRYAAQELSQPVVAGNRAAVGPQREILTSYRPY